MYTLQHKHGYIKLEQLTDHSEDGSNGSCVYRPYRGGESSTTVIYV